LILALFVVDSGVFTYFFQILATPSKVKVNKTKELKFSHKVAATTNICQFRGICQRHFIVNCIFYHIVIDVAHAQVFFSVTEFLSSILVNVVFGRPTIFAADDDDDSNKVEQL
jgi:hypothetical protein